MEKTVLFFRRNCRVHRHIVTGVWAAAPKALKMFSNSGQKGSFSNLTGKTFVEGKMTKIWAERCSGNSEMESFSSPKNRSFLLTPLSRQLFTRKVTRNRGQKSENRQIFQGTQVSPPERNHGSY